MLDMVLYYHFLIDLLLVSPIVFERGPRSHCRIVHSQFSVCIVTMFFNIAATILMSTRVEGIMRNRYKQYKGTQNKENFLFCHIQS